MKKILLVSLTGLTLLLVALLPFFDLLLGTAGKKQQFAVIPAVHEEFKVKVISAIKNDFKIRPADQINLSTFISRDAGETELTPKEICVLRNNEWQEIEYNTPCLKVSNEANRVKKGGAVQVQITRSKLGEILGECFRSENNLYCFPQRSTLSKVVFH